MMEAKSRSSCAGGVAIVAQKEVKATTVECGVGSPSQFPPQPQQPMIPPHYFPPHQYHPPGHFPGYHPVYPPPPMIPYPQMYGYHQYPPHMMRPPHHNVVMPPAFAKPAASAIPIQAISSTKDTPNKTEVKDNDVSARESKTLDQKNSLPIKPTVSTETSVSTLSDTKPVFEEKKIETVINPQVSLQGSTSDESEPDATVSKQQSKNWENDLATNNGHALKETQHITVNRQEGILPFTSQKKLEYNIPSSPASENEEVDEKSSREIEVHPQKDDSTTSSNNAIDEKEEKSEVKLDDIDDSNAIQCDDTTNRQVLEGVESLLLLSEVAASRRPSEEDEPKNVESFPQQPSEHSKPLKKRKLQLPMCADRMEEGPLPKRMPPSPQRTPAFFQFLLHNRESIEQAISSYGDACYGLERSEMVAKEGAMWWLALADDEKQRWADLSTQKYLGLLS